MFWNGVFRRSLRSIVLAGIVMLLYSGMFLGILPDQEGISWESHLIGSLAGIFASFLFKGELEDEEAREVRQHPFADDWEEEESYFLPQDIFEKTKNQRAIERAELEMQRFREANGGYPFWNQDTTF
jgi:hypothetical protein